MKLSRSSQWMLLAFGLTLLFIHLGAGRVLTRHEVLAAQPGREMLHHGTLKRWMLPTLAGVPREAKPPGMMWLIAASIYIFRSEAEWVARLPSALAALGMAFLIARLTARWFGDRIGRLAGFLQLSFVYTLTQAKLAEADMPLTAAVALAMCSLAAGVIDSPAGVVNTRCNRALFWLASAAAFLLKGPIGLVFIALSVAAFAVVRRDRRVIHFLADWPGILCFVILTAGWPAAAWSLDHGIIHTWRSEAIGTATGQFGSDPFYYYFWSVPMMLLPWTPLAIIGLWRGPNAELTGSAATQADRAMLWRFIGCWFVPGILFLTIAMKMKSHHYSLPVLPGLSIPAALGLDYFARRQTSRKQGLVWPFFMAACLLAEFTVWKLVPPAIRLPVMKLIVVFATGGILALYFERRQWARAMIAAYLLTAWAVGIGVQCWVMPPQDDFRYQAHFAQKVNGLVPPGVTIYMLGHREEEQEAEYAYYLRFPMQRLTSAADLPDGIVYAIEPAGMGGAGKQLAACDGLRAREVEGDRLVLVRIANQRPN